MDTQKERKAFEKALVDKCGFNPESSFSVDDKGEYKSDATHFGWAMWQAAKAQAVQEGFVLVEKTKLMQIVGSAAIIEPITRGNPLMSKYKTELDFILSTVRAVIEAQEPAPLKLGDLVEPIDHRYTLASGCERYPYAYVVNTNPFQLMSEEGDMYWCCTVEAGGYKLIKSNDQLPEAVSLRMIREGLLAPVEAQEQGHD
jgi:hypothetical protein